MTLTVLLPSTVYALSADISAEALRSSSDTTLLPVVSGLDMLTTVTHMIKEMATDTSIR